MASDTGAVDLQDAFRLVVPVLAFGLFLVAAHAYRRNRTTRVLLIAAAFGAYAVKGLFISTEVVLPEHGNLLEYLSVLADVAILLLFFFGVVHR